MSFSSDVKSELCRQGSSARHCRIAEMTALLAYAGAVAGSTGPGGQEISADGAVLFTERREIAEKFALLLKQLFEADAEIVTEKGRRGRPVSKVLLTDAEAAGKMFRTAGEALVQKDCCRRAFLRGAFLAAGSVSDPDRSYHCEIVCTSEAQAGQLKNLLEGLRVRARIVQRKQAYVVYVKESSDISDILGLMGARVALMNFENARILKEVRENVNRRVNCETANINKTANAAVRQIEDILLIEKTVGLKGLPNVLDEMAQVRLKYPEATLQELGQYLNPQVGKSGVNHRLRKLGKIAETIRGNRNQGGEREW